MAADDHTLHGAGHGGFIRRTHLRKFTTGEQKRPHRVGVIALAVTTVLV